jgi:hypothetical protein
MSTQSPPKTLHNAFWNVFYMLKAGAKSTVKGLFTEPKKFITLIVLLILLFLVSYYSLLLLWLTPVIILYIFFFVGRRIWEERKKKPIGRLGTVFILFTTLSLVLPCTLGFMWTDTATMKAAKIPRSYTDAGAHNGWILSSDPGLTWDQVQEGGFARASSRAYIFEGSSKPDPNGYPGIIFIITVKSSPTTNAPYLSDYAQAQGKTMLEDQILHFQYEGLKIDEFSKTTGTRTNKAGCKTEYFEYNGKIEVQPTDLKLSQFVAGGKVKIHGEIWKCSSTGTIVAAAGVAQYGYTFESGTFMAEQTAVHKDYPDDTRTWTTAKNLINNVVCS